MKKRILSLALAITCLFTLSSCGGGADGPTGYTTEAVTLLAEGGAFSEELEQLDGDIAFALYGLAGYGLTLKHLTDCTMIRSTGATCEEAAVLIWETEEQAIQAKEAMKDYLQNQIDTNADYRPAEIPKLENAKLSQLGKTVLLVVANDYSAAEKAVPYLAVAEN